MRAKETMDGCTLCPRKCGAKRENGEFGFCRVGNKVTVCRAAPHFWEEPCLCGEKGSGTVFFSGCNLRCVFCQNSKISRGTVGREVNEDELCGLFLSLQEKGVSNINLVTPTPWVPHIKKALDLAWVKGLYLPVVYNCGGYERIETLTSLRGYISVYLPDFKYFSSELAERFSSASDYPEIAKKALYEMVNQRGEARFDSDGIMTKGVIVRHLVLPGHADDSMKVIEYLYREYGDAIRISIMSQYTPMPGIPGELSRCLSESEYKEVVDFAVGIGVRNAYIQDGESAKESFIPEFDTVL